jgi:hypothetical protein
VVEAQDLRTNRRVAVKIIRAIQKYRDASRIEMRVLNKLKERDPTNKQYETIVSYLFLPTLTTVIAFISLIGLTTGTIFALSRSFWACVSMTF